MVRASSSITMSWMGDEKIVLKGYVLFGINCNILEDALRISIFYALQKRIEVKYAGKVLKKIKGARRLFTWYG